MAIQKIPNTLIADNAVTAAKIANGTLTADDIAANSITGAKISATTSLNLAGLDVTGTATMDGLTVSGSSTGTLNVVNFLNTDTSANSTSNRLGLGISNSAGINYTYIEAKEIGVDAYAEMNFYTGSTTRKRLTLGTGGNISFYEDTGATVKFFWDASTESLGIGTSSPSKVVHVKASSDSSGTPIIGLSPTATDNIQGGIGCLAGGEFQVIGTNQTSFHTGSEERMRIDISGNVGIGVTNPDSYDSRAEKLVVGETGDAGITIAGGANSDCRLVFAVTNQTDLSNGSITYDQSADSMAFETAGTERMRIDSAGTIYQRTTTPTLHSATTGIVFENGSLLTDITRGAGKSISVAQNASVDSGNTWAYLATDEASLFQQFNGKHYFKTAPSGSAGADITFTTKMLIDNVGDVGISSTPRSSTNKTTLSIDGAWGGQLDIGVSGTSHARFGSDNFASGKSCRIESNDAIVFKRNGAERMRVHDDGALIANYGVTLGTTTGTYNAANTLDDYEEGTWTGTVTSSTATTVTWGVGNYTKIGNMVYASFRVTVSEQTVGNNYIILYGPFAQHTASIEWIGFCNNYNTGNRESGIIINNSSGNTNEWFVGWQSNDTASKTVRGLIIYQTS